MEECFEQGFYRILRRNFWRLWLTWKEDVNVDSIEFEDENLREFVVDSRMM